MGVRLIPSRIIRFSELNARDGRAGGIKSNKRTLEQQEERSRKRRRAESTPTFLLVEPDPGELGGAVSLGYKNPAENLQWIPPAMPRLGRRLLSRIYIPLLSQPGHTWRNRSSWTHLRPSGSTPFRKPVDFPGGGELRPPPATVADKYRDRARRYAVLRIGPSFFQHLLILYT